MQIFSPYLCISYNIYGEVRRKRVSSEVYLPLEVRNSTRTQQLEPLSLILRLFEVILKCCFHVRKRL